MIKDSDSEIHVGQSAHVHKACGLLQKSVGGDQKLVTNFVWPKVYLLNISDLGHSELYVNLSVVCVWN